MKAKRRKPRAQAPAAVASVSVGYPDHNAELQRVKARGDVREFDRQVHDFCASMYADPLGFVVGAYDWPINGEPGPDVWQAEEMSRIGRDVEERQFDGVHSVLPIRGAFSTGHGAGKSAMFGWLVDWIMSTRRNAQGSITANTSDQLEFKTWAAVQRWTLICISAAWFEINSTIMYRKGHRASWFCVPLANDEKKSDAFQGQHAKDSTSFYLVDEASGIGPKISEAMEGGLTDGEPMIFLAGNMLRNTGWFYESVFGKRRERWLPRVVDTRTTRIANKELIAEWEEDYGVDSDFFRVRVRGLAPRASELQYIDKERVDLARARIQPHLQADPLVAGFDVSGGGKAWNVIRFRRGLNGRAKAPIRMPGAEDPNRSKRVAMCAELLSDRRAEHQLAALFVDQAYGAPIVASLEAMGFTNVFAINFGGDAPLPQPGRTPCENMRAYMYQELKEWLLLGSIPDEDTLCDQLTLPGYHMTKRGRLVIESKEDLQKRGERSPDDADAEALTFASPVAPRRQDRESRGSGIPIESSPGSWMGA